MLPGDLLAEVPRQDQHHVGAVLADRLRRADRDVAARQEAPLLVGVQIDGVVEEIAAHAAVVEQRVALRRRAVAGHAQAVVLEVDQELEDLALVGLDVGAEAGVGLQLFIACRALALAQLERARRCRACGRPRRGSRRRAASRRAWGAPPRRTGAARARRTRGPR